jgi:hypothetical protein
MSRTVSADFLSRAIKEIRSLLVGQWRDGMIPHILYHSGASDYFPDPDFWQTRGSPNAPAMETSGITQPPYFSWSAALALELVSA